MLRVQNSQHPAGINSPLLTQVLCMCFQESCVVSCPIASPQASNYILWWNSLRGSVTRWCHLVPALPQLHQHRHSVSTLKFMMHTANTHVAGAAVIPLQNLLEKMLVFLKSLSYTSLEIGLRRIFHLRPRKILQFFKFLEKSKGGTLLYQKKFSSPISLKFKIWSLYLIYSILSS